MGRNNSDQPDLTNVARYCFIFVLSATLFAFNFRRGVCDDLSKDSRAQNSHGGDFRTHDRLKQVLDNEHIRELVDTLKLGKVESLKYSNLGRTLEDSGLSLDNLERISRTVHFPETMSCKENSKSRTKRSASSNEGTQDEGGFENDKVAFSWGQAVLGGLFAIYRSEPSTGEPCQVLYNVAALWVESMIYAIKKINNDSDVLPNVKLGYEVRDDCSDSNKVLQAGLQFVDAMSANGSCDDSTRTVGVAGTGSSETSDDVAKLLALFELPQVSYSASSPIFSNKQDYPYFLRTVGSDTYQARVLADLAETYQWNYVALIYSDDKYGLPGQEALGQLFVGTGVCAVISRKVSQKDGEEKIEAIVNEIKDDPKIEVIFTFTSKPEIQRVLAAAQRQNLTDRTWVATDSWGDSEDTIRGYEDVVKGMLGVSPRAVIDEDFRKYLYAIDPYTYTDNPWYRESLEGYGCVFNDSESETRGGITCDHSEPFLERLESPSEGRATSRVIDAVYALAYGLHDMLKDCDGDDCFDHFHGSEYLDFVKNVTFPGLTSTPFTFDKNGDPHSEYSVFNLQNVSNEMVFMEVGYWKYDCHLNLTNSVVWPTEGAQPVSRCSEDCQPGTHIVHDDSQVACCWTCTPCPEPLIVTNTTTDARTIMKGQCSFTVGQRVNHVSSSMNSELCHRCADSEYTSSGQTECIERALAVQGWDNPTHIVILVFALIGLIGSSVFFVTYLIFRKTPVIKATSMELSLICLVGIAFIFSSAPIYTAVPTDLNCQAETFVLSIGFSTLIAALLMKTNRISRIFNRKLSDGRPSMLLQIKYQVLFVFTLVLAQVTFCVINLYLYPSSAEYSNTIPRITFIECRVEEEWFSLVVTIGYSLILGMICNYQAFRIRKLPGQFNDSRSIFFTIFTLIIVCFVIVVITMATMGNSKTLGMCLSVLFSGYSSLGLLFGSKMWVVILKPERNVSQPTFQTMFRSTSSTMSPVTTQDSSEMEINGNHSNGAKPSEDDDISSGDDDIFDSGNYSDISTVVGEDEDDLEEFLEEVARLEEEIQSAKKERHASIQELTELKENMRHLEETHDKDLERIRELCRQERQSVIEILTEAGLSEDEIQAKIEEVAAKKSRNNSTAEDETPQQKLESFEAEWKRLNMASEYCLTGFQEMKEKMFPNGLDDLRVNGPTGHKNRAFHPEAPDDADVSPT